MSTFDVDLILESDNRLDEKTLQLWNEISERGMSLVPRVEQGNSTAYAKDAGLAVGAGQILLTLGSSTVLVALVAALKDWLLRQPPNASIKLRHEKFEVELSGKPSAEQIELLERLLKQSEK